MGNLASLKLALGNQKRDVTHTGATGSLCVNMSAWDGKTSGEARCCQPDLMSSGIRTTARNYNRFIPLKPTVWMTAISAKGKYEFLIPAFRSNILESPAAFLMDAA